MGKREPSRGLVRLGGRVGLALLLAGLACACNKDELERLKQENLELKEEISSLKRKLTEHEGLIDFLQNPPEAASITGRRDGATGPIVYRWITIYENPPIDESETPEVGKVPHGTRVKLLDRFDTGVRVYYRVRAQDKLRTDGWVSERFLYMKY